jgi:hypothetical protein
MYMCFWGGLLFQGLASPPKQYWLRSRLSMDPEHGHDMTWLVCLGCSFIISGNGKLREVPLSVRGCFCGQMPQWSCFIYSAVKGSVACLHASSLLSMQSSVCVCVLFAQRACPQQALREL